MSFGFFWDICSRAKIPWQAKKHWYDKAIKLQEESYQLYMQASACHGAQRAQPRSWGLLSR